MVVVDGTVAVVAPAEEEGEEEEAPGASSVCDGSTAAVKVMGGSDDDDDDSDVGDSRSKSSLGGEFANKGESEEEEDNDSLPRINTSASSNAIIEAYFIVVRTPKQVIYAS